MVAPKRGKRLNGYNNYDLLYPVLGKPLWVIGPTVSIVIIVLAIITAVIIVVVVLR